MPSGPSPSRLLVESLPIAAVLLAWTVLSWLMPGGALTAAARDAGAVLAGLYAVVRGVQLAATVSGDVAPGAVRSDDIASAVLDTLGATVPAVLAGGAWLVAGAILYPVESVYRLFPLGGVFASPLGSLVSVCAGTALGVVLLYAVAVGLPAVRAASSGAEPTGPARPRRADDDAPAEAGASTSTSTSGPGSGSSSGSGSGSDD
jgi:hypothetical protein